MADVDTNNLSVSAARETSLGVSSTSVLLLEPNGSPQITADLTKVTRNPIRADRNAQKGVVVDLEAKVVLDLDLTSEHLREFAEATFMATADGPVQFTGNNGLAPTSVTSTEFVVPTSTAIPQYFLVYARGFSLEANNGLHVVGASSTTTAVKVSGLAAETPAATDNVSVEVCGYRGQAGDIQTDADGNLTSTLVDFTTWGVGGGQWVYVGGELSANRFAIAPGANGWRRIGKNGVAAHKITFDKNRGTPAADVGTGKLIDVYFGPYHRNVPVGSSDWLRRYYHFEMAFPNLGALGATSYRYAAGVAPNVVTFDYPLTSKATMNLDAVGTVVDLPTESRLSGYSTPRQPVQTLLFNTAEDVDEIHLWTTDEDPICEAFKSFKVTVNNNISGERILGRLGAAKLNVGRLDSMVEMQGWLDSPEALAAAQASTELHFWAALRNEDGGHVWDCPAGSLESPSLDMPENATVLQSLTLTLHRSPAFGTELSLSRFPYLPST